MRWVLMLFLAFLVALAVAADYAARRVAETALADHVRSDTHASSVHASIGGWPFLYDVLGKSSLSSVDLVLTEVPAGPVTFQSVDVDLTRVGINRHRLWAKRKVTLTSIASGTATVTITTAELTGVVGRSVTVTTSATGQAGLELDEAGAEVPASARIEPGDELVVSAVGVGAVTIDLTEASIVPVCNLTLRVTAQGLVSSCSMSPVPQSVIDTISDQAG